MSNKDSGFLKLYRTFFDHFLWDEEREFSKAEAWIDLLHTARYKEGKSTEMINGQVVEWERGELLASVRFLKNRWNWNSTGKVTRFLELLEKQNMVFKKTEQGVTVISICKYNSYNPVENEDGTVTEHERNSDGTVTEQQQVQNRKKVKKVKKDKESNNTSVITIANDVPNASDSQTWQSAIRISNRLLESILDYDPTHKYHSNKPSVKQWVKDIDLALRRDGRTEEQFNFLIDAIFYKTHKFPNLWDKWAINIQSGGKLRDQFDVIKNQIKKKNGQSINHKIRETEEFLSSYQE